MFWHLFVILYIVYIFLVGMVIYPGKVLNADCFRIGNIGHLFPHNMMILLDKIEQVCQEMGMHVPFHNWSPQAASVEADLDPLSTSTDRDPLSTSTDKDPLSSSTDKDPLSTSTDKDPLSTSTDKDPLSTSTDKDPLSTSTDKDPLSTSTYKDPLSTSTDKDPLSTPSAWMILIHPSMKELS